MPNSIPKDAKIYVAGHTGMVGSAIVRGLKRGHFTNLLVADPPVGARRESFRSTPVQRGSDTRGASLDLKDQDEVDRWFREHRPDYVFLAAAKVGGILANATYPAEFIYDNIAIQAHVIHAAHRHGVRRLLFLGSSCIYPRECLQPIREEYLLTGPLEKTNEAYAVAKIAGLKMCEFYRQQYDADFIAAMPTNLYGPNDNFDLETSHVLPALIRKFHEAKQRGEPKVTVWGSGSPRREFLHVDDLADACLFLMERFHPRTAPDGSDEFGVSESGHPEAIHFLNIGTGTDVTIKELAETVQAVVHPDSEIIWDTSKPDGTPRKLLDVSKLHDLGWRHSIDLQTGIQETYRWFQRR